MHAEFRASAPYKTWHLSVACATDDTKGLDTMDRLTAALAKKNWRAVVRSGNDRFISTEYRRPGEGLYSDWATGEATEFITEARHVLASHGIKAVPKRKLTRADLR